MRLFLFALVSALTILLAQADKMTYEQVLQFSWWDWCRFGVPAIIAVANSFISYLDQTMTTLRNERSSETAFLRSK